MPPAGYLIRELPNDERPRERLLTRGGRALSDSELVAVLLRTGGPGHSALRLATDVLLAHGGLRGLLDRGVDDLRRPGLGPAKTASLLAAAEIGRRLAHSQIPRRLPLLRPEALARYLGMRYDGRHQEVMGAVFLDSRRGLLGEQELYRGTLDRVTVEPREMLKEGLLRGAAAIVVFHTHPSGDPSPSAEDLTFTRRLIEAGDCVGIEILDHLILGHGGHWVSLKQRGPW